MIREPLIQGVDMIEDFATNAQEIGSVAIDTTFLKVGSTEPDQGGNFLGRQKASGMCEFARVQKMGAQWIIRSHGIRLSRSRESSRSY